MTVYDFLKELEQKYGLDAMIRAGIIQYNTAHHISIYEELLLSSKNKQEKTIETLCVKHSITRNQIFRIKKKMSQGIALSWKTEGSGPPAN